MNASASSCIAAKPTNARTLTRAHILLKLSDGWMGAQIVAACDVSPATMGKVRTRFRRGGLEAVLSAKSADVSTS